MFAVGLFFWFAGDLVSTYLGLLAGAVEWNPIWSWVSIDSFWILVIVKVIMLFIFVCSILLMVEIEKFLVGKKHLLAHVCIWLAISVCLFVGFGVTVWNFGVLL